MRGERPAVGTVDDYIRQFPPGVQKVLRRIRAVIKKAAPKATERISYGMPCYTQKRNLVYFAGYKSHIGFYPTSSGIRAFKKELLGYETSKGTVRFSIEQPIPLELVKKIVEYRVKEETSSMPASAKRTR